MLLFQRDVVSDLDSLVQLTNSLLSNKNTKPCVVFVDAVNQVKEFMPAPHVIIIHFSIIDGHLIYRRNDLQGCQLSQLPNCMTYLYCERFTRAEICELCWFFNVYLRKNFTVGSTILSFCKQCVYFFSVFHLFAYMYN